MPATSSNLPKAGGPRQRFVSVLLRMGFTCAPSVTRRAVVSYTAFPPFLRFRSSLFLLHFPWSHLHRTLSGILPCEARTFLTCSLSSLQPRSFILLILYILLFHNSYTLNMLPPINSRIMEFFAISSLGTGRR